MQQPSSQGGRPSAELRSDATRLSDSAANRIHSEVDARKETAVGQAKSASSALERAVGEMDQDTPDWIKSALRQGAQKLQTFAGTVEQKDSRELMRDAQDFARTNPVTFLVACAAAGFAAARVLKAGGEKEGGRLRAQRQQTPPTYPEDPMTTPATDAQSARGEFA